MGTDATSQTNLARWCNVT